MASDDRNARPTDVYRAYDENWDLLYVGISHNAIGRLHQHRRSSAWWDLAVEFSIERYADRWTARKVEAFAIAMDAPRFNIVQDSIAWEAAWADAHRSPVEPYTTYESHEFPIERFGVFRT